MPVRGSLEPFFVCAENAIGIMRDGNHGPPNSQPPGVTDGAAYVSAVPRLDDVGFSPVWIDALSYRRDKSTGVIRNLNVHFQRRDIATAIHFHLHLCRI